MSTGSRPKGSSGEIKKLHATYFSVKNGQQERGYLAGELHGVVGHRTATHQPCLRDYTHGALECPYCSAGLVPVWRGYVPVWDRDWALRYFLINEEYLATTEAIAHREQLTVNRHKNPISPLVPRAEVCLTRELPDRDPWKLPVCMEDLCLALWKLDALTKWVIDQRKKKPVVVPKKIAERLTPGAKGCEPYRAAGEEVEAEYVEGEGVKFADLSAAIIDKARKMDASKNGNGKHAKPKG